MKNYYKEQILQPLLASNPQALKEIKSTMLNDVNKGTQVRIINQQNDSPVDDVQLLTTADEVERWFQRYGF